MSHRRDGFTLIELLAAIAIIGILAAVLFPAIGGIRKRAVQATSKAAFSQLANGILKYRQTYGFYPNIGSETYKTSVDTLHQLGGGSVDPCTKLVKAMSGKNPDGSPLDKNDRNSLNRNAEEFFAFAREDFSATAGTPYLADRFGNQAINLIFDTSNDGRIKDISIPGLSQLPQELAPISTAGGLPARVIIFTSENLVAPQGSLDKSDCMDVIVIQ